MRTLSLYVSPCVVPFDLTSFDSPPLVLLRSLMDWVWAPDLRFLFPSCSKLAHYLISFVNSDQITLVEVKGVCMTYIRSSTTNLLL